MVRTDSDQVPRDWSYLGGHPRRVLPSPTGLSPSMAGFSTPVLLGNTFVTPRPLCRGNRQLPLPPIRNACRLARTGFGLIPFRSPLLRKSNTLSFPAGTKMFQFPAFASHAYGFSVRFPAHRREGCPIRKSPDQGFFAAPRGLSQLDASFIASWHLVILDALLVA